MLDVARRIPSLVLATLAVAIAGEGNGASAAAPPPPAFCSGQYADDFGSLSAAARDFDHRPDATFSYCTRNTAVYECLSYGSDGTVRRDRRKVVAHGTAFAYRKQAGETLLLTNEHVAVWPAITDASHQVQGVPPGCKRVSDALSLVDDEDDSYGKDDIPLTRVVTDPQLDVAVVKARAALQVMPWKVGRSAGIHERNLVEVRGFPLGAFRATNIGKVVSAHDHDDYRDWDHDDFVVDALLSKGNSGSPVLGISCATGEYELVGIYHAGYSEGAALNVVVGIDQVRDLMATLKRTTHDHAESAVTLDGTARALVSRELAKGGDLFFPVGAQVAVARGAPAGALLLALFSKDFPANGEPSLVFEDLPAPDAAAFGTLGSVWFGSARGLKAVDLRSLDADGQGQVKRALAIMTSDLAAQVTLRAFDQGEPDAKQAEGRRRLAKAIARVGASRNEVLQPIADLSERLSPQVGEAGTPFADLGRPAPADGQQRAVVGATNAPVAGPTGPVAGGP
ncbi:MAG TPA: serine protease [Polyangia bacterium]|nr:serine protease [Polyangia bacterium]